MGFQLTPANVPSQKRTKRTPYQDMVAQFLESGLDSARVDGTDYKPTTLAAGLRKAADAADAGLSVIQRGNEVFIFRTAEDAAADTSAF